VVECASVGKVQLFNVSCSLAGVWSVRVVLGEDLFTPKIISTVGEKKEESVDRSSTGIHAGYKYNTHQWRDKTCPCVLSS
jgi:hypothetical protein